MPTHLRAGAARRALAAAAGALLVAGALGAAPPAGAGTATTGADRAERAAAQATPGLVLVPTVIEQDPGLPNHTVYRPEDLASVGRPLPIIAWGNGVCLGNGTMYRDFLEPLASFGALVVSSGVPDGQGGTSAEMLTEAIDWAIAENARPDSPYFGRLATDQVALMGQSCGGIQAIQVSDDPRVATTVAWNSGLFVGSDKAPLTRLHAPTAWFTGGEADIAFANSVDDYALVPAAVPAALGHYADAGHVGLFFDPALRAQAIRAAVHWLAAAFTGDEASLRQFTACGLCDDPRWTVDAKNWG